MSKTLRVLAVLGAALIISLYVVSIASAFSVPSDSDYNTPASDSGDSGNTPVSEDHSHDTPASDINSDTWLSIDAPYPASPAQPQVNTPAQPQVNTPAQTPASDSSSDEGWSPWWGMLGAPAAAFAVKEGIVGTIALASTPFGLGCLIVGFTATAGACAYLSWQKMRANLLKNIERSKMRGKK
jgi:hypothetical protein